ncbi:DUF4892 domain-containing protein [Motiliproteus sediminis]|uniref:DUF4892 domain-containing protein n=1 Tax=Motiliproteus sediminis TaxID=1468178 RepID=UPI001AEFFE78|nr:DUF4892 domain-containing protein [Motiliproteus sediminis]
MLFSGFLIPHLPFRHRSVVFSIVAALLVSMAATARGDIPGSADPEGLERYPLSYIVEYQQQVSPEYRLALGPMKKVNGVISAERSRALAGALVRVTYRIPDGHGSEEAFGFMRQQLDNAGYRSLYLCEGRRCGSSNQWANTQFGIAQLYGLDRQQWYGAFEDVASQRVIALYAVQRGNKRVYLHLDLVKQGSNAASSSVVTSQLNRGERLYVELGDPLDSLAASINQLLNQQPGAVLRLVGHSNRGGDLAARIASSRVDAERVRDRLIVLGVPAVALEAHGVGDLVPAYDPSIPAVRVELLKGGL